MPRGMNGGTSVGAEGFEWTLTVLTTVQGPHAGTRAYRLRVRTAQGERAIDVPPAELPARLAELATRLGVEGIRMSTDTIDLAGLADQRTQQLAEIDREIAEREAEFERDVAELRQRRRRIEIEAREFARAVERVAAKLGEGAKAKASRQPRVPREPRRRKTDDAPKTPDLIVEALEGGAMSIASLAEHIDRPLPVVARAVGQLAKAGRVRRDGDVVTLLRRRRAA